MDFPVLVGHPDRHDFDFVANVTADDLQADLVHCCADKPVECCMLDSMLVMPQAVSQGVATQQCKLNPGLIGGCVRCCNWWQAALFFLSVSCWQWPVLSVS